MPLWEIIIACVLAGGLAIPFSMVGQGGGSTYVPILLAVGMGMHEASTTSLFMIMLASISATLVFGRSKTVDWRLLLAVAIPSLGSSFAGGFVAQWISVSALKITFAVVLMIAAVFMLRPVSNEGTAPAFMPRIKTWDRTCGGFEYRIDLLVIPVVTLAGFIAGMIGVGGGLFVLPLLALLFGCPMRIAIGVSSTYVGLAATTGFVGHLAGGDPFDIWVALPLAAAAFIGARIGPSISLKTSIPTLRRVLAVILVGLAAWMIIKLFV
ncbi:MAG: sulfite exporter TauE/SafE family protein [Dehalococcoidia bacterium]|nr:sulfite exporter TauE/SafE family protein [Dehalococcoidia bacterium]